MSLSFYSGDEYSLNIFAILTNLHVFKYWRTYLQQCVCSSGFIESYWFIL